MPSGVSVVDAIKNLIRKPINHGPRSDDVKIPDGHNTQPAVAHSRAPRQQEQAHPQPPNASSVTENPQPQQPMRSPPAHQLAQSWVDGERDAKSKMPTYKGLEDFKLLEKMGDGAFSNVYHALEITTRKKVAVKVVRKYELNASQRANILKEVQIMRGVNHTGIVKLYNFFESPEHYFLIMELMEGGELFHQIVKLTYFSENLSRHVILQVAHGIRHLHEECGVVHRDIKPENLLFERIEIVPSKNPVVRPYDEEKEDEGEFIPGVGGGGIGKVKIADFGLSKVVWNEETMTPCGTVGYTAPEIVKDERYSKSVDMWALGCVLYTLLCGFPPFLSPWWDDISHSGKSIVHNRAFIKDPNFAAKDLIQNLLCVDPSRRYTIDEFLAHPWCNAAPLLSAARGRIREGKSPGLATLKEAFDITYAVHRMEEENARRRKYNNRGVGGFLSKLNEDDEGDEEETGQISPAQLLLIKDGHAVPRDPALDFHGSNRKRQGRGNKDFELDMRGATLLGRRHKKGVIGGKSPLSGQPLQAEHTHPDGLRDEYGISMKNFIHT